MSEPKPPSGQPPSAPASGPPEGSNQSRFAADLDDLEFLTDAVTETPGDDDPDDLTAGLSPDELAQLERDLA